MEQLRSRPERHRPRQTAAASSREDCLREKPSRRRGSHIPGSIVCPISAIVREGIVSAVSAVSAFQRISGAWKLARCDAVERLWRLRGVEADAGATATLVVDFEAARDPLCRLLDTHAHRQLNVDGTGIRLSQKLDVDADNLVRPDFGNHRSERLLDDFHLRPFRLSNPLAFDGREPRPMLPAELLQKHWPGSNRNFSDAHGRPPAR